MPGLFISFGFYSGGKGAITPRLLLKLSQHRPLMSLMKRDIPFNGLTQWSPVITNKINQDKNKRFLITLLFVCFLERRNIKKWGAIFLRPL